jgi:hypothetical protein
MLLSPFGIRVAKHNPIGIQNVRVLQSPAPKTPDEPPLCVLLESSIPDSAKLLLIPLSSFWGPLQFHESGRKGHSISKE